MHHEFECFGEMINKVISLCKTDTIKMTNYQKLYEQLKDAVADIRSQMMTDALKFETPARLELYINRAQTIIVSLCDTLMAHMTGAEIESLSDITSDSHPANLKKLCFWQLMELNEFLETYFEEYYNRNVKVPGLLRSIHARTLEPQLTSLQQKLIAMNIREDLVGIVISAISEVLEDDRTKPISFRHLDYLDELYQQLVRLTETTDAVNATTNNTTMNNATISNTSDSAITTTETFYSLLRYLNLNSESFCIYSFDRYREMLDEENDNHEKIHKIVNMERINSQQQTKFDVAYNPQHSSVKTQIANWLNEERKAITHTLSFQHPSTVQLALPSGNTPGNNDTKIELAITLAMLAYLIRLMVEANIIKAGSAITTILRIFARYFSTPQSPNISDNSFYNHYFNLKQATVRAIRKLLLTMVHLSKAHAA